MIKNLIILGGVVSVLLIWYRTEQYFKFEKGLNKPKDYIFRAINYSYKKDYYNAIKTIDYLLQKFTLEEKELADAYFAKAVFLYKSLLFKDAVEQFEKAFEIVNKLSIDTLKIENPQLIFDCYREAGMYPQANKWRQLITKLSG